jgi:hypothetical protein
MRNSVAPPRYRVAMPAATSHIVNHVCTHIGDDVAVADRHAISRGASPILAVPVLTRGRVSMNASPTRLPMTDWLLHDTTKQGTVRLYVV